MKTSLLRSVLLFSLFLIWGGNFLSAQSMYWMDGQWEGTGYQKNNGHTWSILLTVDVEKGNFYIEYPSLGCGGAWELRETADGRAVFEEVITKGTLRCVTFGEVVVTPVGRDYLSFSWFEPYDGSLGAWSTLTRIAPL